MSRARPDELLRRDWSFGDTAYEEDSLLKGFDGHAASPRNLIAAVSTGSPRSSGATAHVVRALSCEFSGFGGLGASALSFQLRGFAPCQLGHALAPGLARLRRNPLYARAGT